MNNPFSELFPQDQTPQGQQGASPAAAPEVMYNRAGLKPRVLPTTMALCSVVDATGSSQPFSQGIQTICQEAAQQISKQIAVLKLGLHISRDLECDRDANFSLGYDLSPEQLAHQLSSLTFEGGGDDEETQFDAVLTAARDYPWPTERTARRVMLLCSSSSSKPTRDARDAAALAAELVQMNIKVVVVAPNGVNLHELATLTGGISLELSKTPQPSDVQRITSMLTRTLTQAAARSSGTLQMPANPLPAQQAI